MDCHPRIVRVRAAQAVGQRAVQLDRRHAPRPTDEHLGERPAPGPDLDHCVGRRRREGIDECRRGLRGSLRKCCPRRFRGRGHASAPWRGYAGARRAADQLRSTTSVRSSRGGTSPMCWLSMAKTRSTISVVGRVRLAVTVSSTACSPSRASARLRASLTPVGEQQQEPSRVGSPGTRRAVGSARDHAEWADRARGAAGWRHVRAPNPRNAAGDDPCCAVSQLAFSPVHHAVKRPRLTSRWSPARRAGMSEARRAFWWGRSRLGHEWLTRSWRAP